MTHNSLKSPLCLCLCCSLCLVYPSWFVYLVNPTYLCRSSWVLSFAVEGLKIIAIYLVQNSVVWQFGLGSVGWFFWTSLGSLMSLRCASGLTGAGWLMMASLGCLRWWTGGLSLHSSVWSSSSRRVAQISSHGGFQEPTKGTSPTSQEPCKSLLASCLLKSCWPKQVTWLSRVRVEGNSK